MPEFQSALDMIGVPCQHSSPFFWTDAHRMSAPVRYEPCLTNPPSPIRKTMPLRSCGGNA